MILKGRSDKRTDIFYSAFLMAFLLENALYFNYNMYDDVIKEKQGG